MSTRREIEEALETIYEAEKPAQMLSRRGLIATGALSGMAALGRLQQTKTLDDFVGVAGAIAGILGIPGAVLECAYKDAQTTINNAPANQVRLIIHDMKDDLLYAHMVPFLRQFKATLKDDTHFIAID